jgi:hypothetical protein
MSDVNRENVTLNFRDVDGRVINSDVEIKFYNKDVTTLSQIFNVRIKGAPVVVPNVPAFPTGRAEVFINPASYRHKTVLKTVFPGETNVIDEIFFVNPEKARPKSLDFSDLSSKSFGEDLRRILTSSGINESSWNALDKRNRAGILNICAKMHSETVGSNRKLIGFVEKIEKELITKKNRARIFARVKETLFDELLSFPQTFKTVSGVMHSFPGEWHPVGDVNSFKSRDEAGNIQFTFATNNDGLWLADIDLDDHQGIKHAGDVIKHKFSGNDTDPYDIHQILIYFQKIDPGYTLV